MPDGAHDDIEILLEHQNDEVGPIVTVAISLYNYKDYIISCLESVKAQTILLVDLIVVDDCSNDGSSQLVYKWLMENGERFSRYYLLRHRKNLGLPSARNSAFFKSKTEYVFVLDADNMLYPMCLERLISALDHCDASFAYCYLEKFGELYGLQNTKAWNPASFQYGNAIDAMVLLRKSIWQRVGGYSTTQVLGWEDFELWFKVAKVGGWGVLVPEILARYRVHYTSMLHTVTNPNTDRIWAYLRATYPEFFMESSVRSS
jgi:glycosyltransferase involved in cell wall biosynthesis